LRRVLLICFLAGLLVLAGLVWWTSPKTLDPASLPASAGDPERGAILYLIGGCIGCHSPPEGSGRDKSLPSGGHPLPSPFGNFYAPNITPDSASGIGGWSFSDFATAMVEGTSPEGRHYYPAFPYSSYRYARLEDLADLFAYLKTLPPVTAENRSPDLPLSSSLRKFLGLWKVLALEGSHEKTNSSKPESWNRGAYLVRSFGHCGECHTPRDIFFVMDPSRYLEGGPHPEGKGSVPSLIDLIGRGEYEDAAALKEAFEYGELFGYDGMSSGGMAEVQTNLSKLPTEDLDAIVEYLVSLE
jgi:mono/diheme cytochrome c family protein